MYGDLYTCEVCGIEVLADNLVDQIDSCSVCNIVAHKTCNKKFSIINPNIQTCFSTGCSSSIVSTR